MNGTLSRLTRRGFAAVRGIVAFLVLLAVGTVGVASATSHLPGTEGTLWVTDRNGTPGGLFVIDAATGAVIQRIPVGLGPIGVVAPPGTGKVYVSNETSNSVSVVSKPSLTQVKEIPTGVGSKPHHIAQSPDGSFVYVALYGTNTVAVVDTTTDDLAPTIVASSRSGIRTHAVWVSSDGATLYAANTFTTTATPLLSGTVSAIDVQTGSVLWEIEVGVGPSEVLVTADGSTAYVSMREEDVVRVLDLTTDPPSITVEVPVGDQPDTLQLTNDGETLVVALRGTPARVDLVDTSTLVVTPVLVPGTTTGHQWLSADGRYTFVAVEDPETPGIAVIDNQSGTFVELYPLAAGARPHGVFFEPTCEGRAATIVGTEGPDLLFGTPGPDVIVALGGNDSVYGYGGNDVICGGAGDDTVVAGAGDDTVVAGAGNDTVVGGAGDDTIHGGSGDDRIVGSSGRDDLRGAQGLDVLVGGSGNDALNGGPDADTCNGGTGINTFTACEVSPAMG